MELTPQLKEDIARVLSYVLQNEESDFEDTIDEHGIDSEAANAHIYEHARSLWCALEIDLI